MLKNIIKRNRFLLFFCFYINFFAFQYSLYAQKIKTDKYVDIFKDSKKNNSESEYVDTFKNPLELSDSGPRSYYTHIQQDSNQNDISKANDILLEEIKNESKNESMSEKSKRKTIQDYISSKVEGNKEIIDDLVSIYKNPAFIKPTAVVNVSFAIPVLSQAWLRAYEQTHLSNSLLESASGKMSLFGWSIGLQFGGLTKKHFFIFAAASAIWINNQDDSLSLDTNQDNFSKANFAYEKNSLDGIVLIPHVGASFNIVGNNTSKHWMSLDVGGGPGFYWSNGFELYSSSIIPSVFGGVSLYKKFHKNFYFSVNTRIWMLIMGRKNLDYIAKDSNSSPQVRDTLVNNYIEFEPMMMITLGVSLHIK